MDDDDYDSYSYYNYMKKLSNGKKVLVKSKGKKGRKLIAKPPKGKRFIKAKAHSKAKVHSKAKAHSKKLHSWAKTATH